MKKYLLGIALSDDYVSLMSSPVLATTSAKLSAVDRFSVDKA